MKNQMKHENETLYLVNEDHTETGFPLVAVSSAKMIVLKSMGARRKLRNKDVVLFHCCSPLQKSYLFSIISY